MATQKRKKLTLDQVEIQMEVLTKEEMNALKGGGDGTYSNPYTLNEYNLLCDYGIFSGGYVEGCGYINALSPVVVTAPKKKDPFTNQDSYDLTWGSEYETLMSQNFSSGGGNDTNNNLNYPNNQYGYNGVMDYGSGHFNGVINIARKEHWITQLPSKCYDACVTILKNYGVEAMGRDYRFIIADQNGSNLINKDITAGTEYIKSQLAMGKPVIVGVDDNLRQTSYNVTHKATDHFIVIVGVGEENGKVYYNFFDVGTKYMEKGTSTNNKLFVNENNLIQNEKYTITEIRKNK